MASPLPVVLRSSDLKLAEGLRSPRAAPVEGPKGEGGGEKECDLLETTQLREGRVGSQAPKPGPSCGKGLIFLTVVVSRSRVSVRHLASFLAHRCSRNG